MTLLASVTLRHIVMTANVMIFWFVVGIPMGMLAQDWWDQLKDTWRARDDEVWNACVRPGE